MSDEPKKKRSRAWIASALLALVTLYPLSIGPAFWLCLHTENRTVRAAYEIVYAPILWATIRSDTIRDVVIPYLARWTPSDSLFPSEYP
jgi:hypothetical protein